MKWKNLILAVIVLALTAPALAADTATIHCLSPNAGFTVDGVSQPVMTYGDTVEIEVSPGGSLLQLWSCGWEGVNCQWIDYTVLPGTEWNVQPLCDVRIVLQELDACGYNLVLHCPPSEDPQSWVDGLTIQINGYTGPTTICPPVDSIYWDWGDGSTENAWFPAAHTYQYPGDYTVCTASFDPEGSLLGIDSCDIAPEAVNLVSCEGFAPPMVDHPVGADKNSVLPMMMKLFDAEGYELTDADLVAAPVIEVLHTPGFDQLAIDISEDTISAGLGTDGNLFEYRGGAYWHFNLKVSNYSAPGEYLVTVISGAESEYTIDPTCMSSFLVQ